MDLREGDKRGGHLQKAKKVVSPLLHCFCSLLNWESMTPDRALQTDIQSLVDRQELPCSSYSVTNTECRFFFT